MEYVAGILGLLIFWIFIQIFDGGRFRIDGHSLIPYLILFGVALAIAKWIVLIVSWIGTHILDILGILGAMFIFLVVVLIIGIKK